MSLCFHPLVYLVARLLFWVKALVLVWGGTILSSQDFKELFHSLSREKPWLWKGSLIDVFVLLSFALHFLHWKVQQWMITQVFCGLLHALRHLSYLPYKNSAEQSQQSDSYVEKTTSSLSKLNLVHAIQLQLERSIDWGKILYRLVCSLCCSQCFFSF